MRAILRQSTQPAAGPVPVAIYTRVSTTGQVGGRFDSCESQAANCREYLAKQANEGWHEVACFTDAAYSGATMNRPGIQALKRQIEAGAIKVVLIFKLERVLRSTDEWGPFRAFLQQHGCRLVSTTEDLSEDTPSGRLKNNLLVSVAEYERLNTAEKVRAKMLAQAKRGYWNYGLVPYGYSYAGQSQTLAVDPVESLIVQRVFTDASKLVPLGEVAEALNREGRRTRVRTYQLRDRTSRSVGGRLFRSDSLRAIIRNPIYAGRVRFRGEEYPGQHAALVSDDLWEKANAAITHPDQPPPVRFRPSDKHFHLLKGLVYCGVCGRAMVPHANGKRNAEGRRYRYYTCGHLYREREQAACGVRHVSAMGLERVVIAVVGEIHRHPDVLRAAIENSLLRNRGDRTPLLAKAAEIKKAMGVLGQRLRNCVDAIEAGGADLLGGELRERALTLRDEKQRLLVEEERVRQELLVCDQDGLESERIAVSLERFGEVFAKLEPPQQKELVGLCIERISLTVDRDHLGRRHELPADARWFQLQIKLPVARLVDGMEQRLVVQQRMRSGNPPASRMLSLVVTAALGKHGTATIIAPFVREIGNPWKRKAPIVDPEFRHPIHQACEWRCALAAKPKMTIGEFAREVRVSRATLDFHLLLLRLAPEIQCFLRQLVRRDEIYYFGMIRMGVIARTSLRRQRQVFAELRAEWTHKSGPDRKRAMSAGAKIAETAPAS